ncbi:MAG: HNH endonuclease signature motif containing protein [Mycobacterium sp.]
MSITCLGCGLNLQGRRRKVFCTNACQQSHRRRLLLAAWLETGVCGRTSYQGHYVRDYLFEQQDGRCSICGMDNSWNGASLVLIVDHINGDPNDDHRENLRLICPNCDSQLPTYKARNRGSGRYYRRQRYADGQSY